MTAASATVSLDAATSSEAKERGKDTVMEDSGEMVVASVCRGSDVGTARRSVPGDDKGAGTVLRNTGGDIGPAALARWCRTKRGTRRGDMRRTVDDDWPTEDEATEK